MTVERALYYQRYIGLSTDDKPMPLDDVDLSLMPGAEFFETDTCDVYTWSGSEWVERDTFVSTAMHGYRSSDATYQPLRLDRSTNSIQTIDYSHHEIHAGSSFTCHFSQSAPTNVGEMTIIAFTTADSTTYCHMFAEASSTAASTFSIYEASDLDVDEGTDLTIYNRNRNSSTTSTVKSIETTPEVGKATSYTVAQAAGATLSTAIPIYQKYLGAAAAGADTSGETRDSHEFVLKRNTQYAFVVANMTDDTNTHNIILNWYEHVDISAL